MSSNDEAQIQLAPIDVNLNGCQFAIGERPDGMKVLQFIHQSGILVFTAVMTKEAASNLARMLTGVTIARAMDIPKSKGH